MSYDQYGNKIPDRDAKQWVKDQYEQRRERAWFDTINGYNTTKKNKW